MLDGDGPDTPQFGADYKTSECIKYNGCIADKICDVLICRDKNTADTIKQVRIHAKYTILAGIGPIFGGKVALTRCWAVPVCSLQHRYRHNVLSKSRPEYDRAGVHPRTHAAGGPRSTLVHLTMGRRLERVTALVPLLLTGVRLHPPGRTDKHLCRCFGAPARRVFPDHLGQSPTSRKTRGKIEVPE